MSKNNRELYCVMGYGMMLPAEIVPFMIPLLALETPDLAVRPLPWKISQDRQREFARIWRQRYWHQWLGERLEFPFDTITAIPGIDTPMICKVLSLMPSSREESENVGIYLALDMIGDQGIVMGATNVMPCDPTCPSALALAEYRAYRKMVGPPPAVRDKPDFFLID